MTEEIEPKKVRRRNYADPLDEFVAFNFAQATTRIIDNIGFTSTKPSVLELLSRLMSRYFEDLCKRIVYSKEDTGRFDATMEDVENAYKDLRISIPELQNYLKQVRQIPSIPQMPLIPFQGPNKTDLTIKSPKKKIAPITDETSFDFNSGNYLQESIKGFEEFLCEFKGPSAKAEHPLVSLHLLDPKPEKPQRKVKKVTKFFKVRIGKELMMERDLGRDFKFPTKKKK